MTACPKQQNVRDKKFRASFGIFDEHHCIITDRTFSEDSYESVDGAHRSIGNFARGMKASDDLILPMGHCIHIEFDRDQKGFIDAYIDKFIAWGCAMGIYWIDFTDNVEFVKACARAYYEKWKEGNG